MLGDVECETCYTVALLIINNTELIKRPTTTTSSFMIKVATSNLVTEKLFALSNIYLCFSIFSNDIYYIYYYYYYYYCY